MSDLGRLCILYLLNCHAGLVPEASNNPIKIQVLNWGLIWIIEMITEIKFAIMKLLIHLGEEHDLFWLQHKNVYRIWRMEWQPAPLQ